jgi:hypothetical protein
MAIVRLRGGAASAICGFVVALGGCGGGDFSTSTASGVKASGGNSGRSGADAGSNTGGSGKGGTSGSGGLLASGGDVGSGGLDAGSSGASGGTGLDAGNGGASNGGGASTGGVRNSGGSGGQGGSGGVVGCAVDNADSTGVFVDAAAANSVQDGTMRAPFAALDNAVQKAFDGGITTIYIATGTYNGTTIGGFSKPLTLSGGWTTGTSAWTRGCDPALRDATIIVAPSEATPGLYLNANQATLRLEVLTVRSADAASAQNGTAGSLFGIILQGPSSNPSLELDDVVVAAGRGSDGQTPAAAGASGNLTCNGRSDCPTVVADGVQGGAGAQAVKGTFVPLGYTPSDGQPGSPGTDGTNGAKGTPGTTCTGCKSGCQGLFPLCSAVGAPNVSGTSGLCGCGGVGGPAGVAGRGGGASVALLVSGGATVVATNSLLRSGRGGDASGGGDGGDPGPGTAGAHGTGASCSTEIKCTSGATCAFAGIVTTCTAMPGQPGGAGRPGGVGGPGGGGWGGPSFSVVLLGGATFTPVGSTLDFGNAGKNGDGNVASGNAGTMLTQ